MTTVVWDKSRSRDQDRDQARINADIVLGKGLDFVLRHFKTDSLFPRTISTKVTQAKQKIVYSREEALARFKQANGLDCRISAYHSTNWRKGLNKLVAPDFLFMDLDLGTLGTTDNLAKALNHTLSNIKEKLGGVPSVVWSGNGYHIYQPVEAFILEEQQVFSRDKFEQPSRRLIQFAERYLTAGKMDECHNQTVSFNNCMVRVPGSYNSKSDPPKPVKIIQTWDGNRPEIKPLLFKFYLYLQGLRLKKIRKEQREEEYYSKYHSPRQILPYQRHHGRKIYLSFHLITGSHDSPLFDTV